MSNVRKRDYETLRGRILLVFQESWRNSRMMYCGEIHGSDKFQIIPGAVPIADIARELGVTRQAVYRAAPELRRR